MKTMIYLLLCLVLALALSMPALADDADLLEALTAGKTVALVTVELPDTSEDDSAMPLSISPDGRTVLLRRKNGMPFLIRDGKMIELSLAPERGAGDPYEKLEYEAQWLMQLLPGPEGPSWSPDSRYLLLTSQENALKRNIAMDLVVLDAQTGEIFLEQAYYGGSMERGDFLETLQSPDFGSVVEARYDSTSRYIYFVARLNTFSVSFGLYRYSLADRRTELLMENLGIAHTGRILYEARDGAWLLMLSSDNGNSNQSADVIRWFRPDAGSSWLITFLSGGETQDSFQRGIRDGAIRTIQACYSPKTGFGLILTGSQVASQMTNLAQTSTTASREVAIASVSPSIYATPRLNRITPDEIDPNKYWELTGDMTDPSSLCLSEFDEELMALITRFAQGEDLSDAEREPLSAYSQQKVRNPQPRINCLCISPDGRLALLSISESIYEKGVFCLVDLMTMALYPVESPEELGPVPYASPYYAEFQPGMVWNDDGTLLIYTTSDRAVHAWRLEVQ